MPAAKGAMVREVNVPVQMRYKHHVSRMKADPLDAAHQSKSLDHQRCIEAVGGF